MRNIAAMISAALVVLFGVMQIAAQQPPPKTDPPKVQQLRVQKVGAVSYFHLQIEPPADLRWPASGSSNSREFIRLPRLVPQDDATQAVYFRNSDFAALTELGITRSLQAGEKTDAIEFFGKVKDKPGKAKLLLQYPTQPIRAGGERQTPALRMQQLASWAEAEVTVDFSTAKDVDLPAIPRTRPNRPYIDDLEGFWAVAQGQAFALLEAQTQFGFYRFAQEANRRKYAVPVTEFHFQDRIVAKAEDDFFINRQLYEITTGAAAIAETLALKRMRNAQPAKKEKDPQRSVDVGKLPRITIAEKPWARMMGEKKPAAEPLAALVPADNYYVHFNSFVKFLETSELLDQWGTSFLRAVQANGRDHRLKERLERQLCLKSTKLARILGPALVKSLALTGSDPYLLEGSDLTVLFHVSNRVLFLKAVEPHINEARKIFAGKLRVEKQSYRGVDIDSFVSPLREVSLHRAGFGEFVVCSNSPAGIRRVIDVYKGKLKPLAQAPDFQYMRSAFRGDEGLEDGFLFLSDAFLRNQAGPEVRIKERRRLEALASLSLANHAALFTAWEMGRLPVDHKELLAQTGLKSEDLFSPDGDAIRWSAEHGTAFSPFYNTLVFATPLIEIPIDRVTADEQAEYEQFRREYMGLWRPYFDPIAMRIKLGPTNGEGKSGQEIRWETWIVPLVHNSQYGELRRLIGDGTVQLDPASINAKTIAQFVAHLSPSARERDEYGNVFKSIAPDVPGLNWLGNGFFVRIDDSPVYHKILQRIILREIDRDSVRDFDEDVRLLCQVPITFGMEIRNPLIFGGVLATLKKTLEDALPGAVEWKPLQEPYKGIAVVRIRVRPEGVLGAFGGRQDAPFTPSLFYALVDGRWYASLRQESLQDEIDAALARRQPADKAKAVEVNSSLYFSPRAATTAQDMLRTYVEWQTHQQAVANADVLYPLYRGRLLAPGASQPALHQAALKHLGFIPVSTDDAPYVYEARTDEIVNKRHGNLRRPHLHDTMEESAPLAQLFEQIRWLRADLRFEQDGLRSVVTFKRK